MPRRSTSIKDPLPVVCAALLFVAQNAVGLLDTTEPNRVGRLAGVLMGAEKPAVCRHV
jgi:hypothetical protein